MLQNETLRVLPAFHVRILILCFVVLLVTTLLLDFALAPSKGWEADASVEKIRAGMSTHEVEAILGNSWDVTAGYVVSSGGLGAPSAVTCVTFYEDERPFRASEAIIVVVADGNDTVTDKELQRGDPDTRTLLQRIIAWSRRELARRL